MKNTLSLILIIFVFAFSNAQDTEDETKQGVFKVGANLGVNTTDYPINLGIDIAYLRKIGEKIDVGATTGYSAYLLMSPTSDMTIHSIPLAATGQYSIFKKMYVGLDIGVGYYWYSTFNTTANGMGYMFQPKLGFQSKLIELYLAYKKIDVPENNIDFNSGYINVGLNFKLF